MENNLGKQAKDKVTNCSGTITGVWISITGPKRILIENIDTTNRPIEIWFDEERVELIGE